MVFYRRKHLLVMSLVASCLLAIVIIVTIDTEIREKLLVQFQKTIGSTQFRCTRKRDAFEILFQNITERSDRIFLEMKQEVLKDITDLEKKTEENSNKLSIMVTERMSELEINVSRKKKDLQDEWNKIFENIKSKLKEEIEFNAEKHVKNIKEEMHRLQEELQDKFENLKSNETSGKFGIIDNLVHDEISKINTKIDTFIQEMNSKLSEVNSLSTKANTQPRNPEDLGEGVLSKRDTENQQQCLIPNLNPFHPDVMSFMKYRDVPAVCSIKSLSKIIDGKLSLKAENVQNAGFYYILRQNDFDNKLSEWHPLMEKSNGTNVDVLQDLKDDFIRVDITMNDITKSEYHLHVIKDVVQSEEKKLQIEKTARDENKLNILILMVDSLSHANAARMLNRSYAYLQNDPQTAILQGQGIVGDGTTPQLSVMLTGKQEHEMPEARRGFPNSSNIDPWPFIFKDFEEIGYKTVFSEDEPIYGSFQYRLHGWNKQPTLKYLRPWWIATQQMVAKTPQERHSCPHKIAFQYAKEFYKTYEVEKKFSFFVFSNLAHGHPNDAQDIDEDFMKLMDDFRASGYLNNTVVIFFGDHGSRNDEYRATLQGKLEERLPFMAIKMPQWFSKNHPQAFNNLQKNAKVLTSYYDIHATLKHLLSFPNQPDLGHLKHGQSLFTDIVSLNRSCNDAGIDKHWCTCVSYEDIDINGELATTISKFTIDFINNLSKNLTDKCIPFTLSNVMRIGEKSAQNEVQHFQGTYQDSKCTGCNVIYNTNITFHFEYEIVFKVQPGDAIFEATILYTKDKHLYTTRQYISRLNKYGNQPKCIADRFPHLRKFCYCG